MIGIYKITNIINGKCYIGQSKCINRRWENHKCLNNAKNKEDRLYNFPIYRAIRKYGLENFNFEVLEECEKENLSERELFYIKQFNSVKMGYNQTYATNNPMDDPILREKARINMKISHNTIEHKEKQSKITSELWQNEEYREKVTTAIRKSKEAKRKEKIIIPKEKKIKEKIKKIKISKKRIRIRHGMSKEIYSIYKSNEMKQAWKDGKYSQDISSKNIAKFHDRFKNDEIYREIVIQNMKNNKPNKKAIIMLDKETKIEIMEFEKLMDSATWIRHNTNYIKADYSTIRKCAQKGINHVAYGYSWILKNEVMTND